MRRAGAGAYTGARSTVLSSRYAYPDQFYRLDADHKVTFAIDASQFKANYTALALVGFAVTVLNTHGAPLPSVPLTVTRASDQGSVAATTGADGAAAGDPGTMAPFAAWKGATPLDAFTVAFAPGFDTTQVGDVQLAIDFAFTYRADGA